MPSSGSGTSSGASGSGPAVAVPITIGEIIETCGIPPVLFNMDVLDDFAAIIDRHIPFARAYVKTRVGDPIWNTVDPDKATQIKEALLYKVGARVLFAALVQRVTGTGAPLLMSDPGTIRETIRDLNSACDHATDNAMLTAPNDPSERQESAQWTADPARDAAFKSGADTRY